MISGMKSSKEYTAIHVSPGCVLVTLAALQGGSLLGQEGHSILPFFYIHISPPAGCGGAGPGASLSNKLSDSEVTEMWSPYVLKTPHLHLPKLRSLLKSLWRPSGHGIYLPYWSIVIMSHARKAIYLLCPTPSLQQGLSVRNYIMFWKSILHDIL